ncbi:MAG: MlaD family protein [Verrucomicrobiota bacterium]
MALQDLTPQLRTRLSRMERAVGWFVILSTALLLFGFGYYIYNRAETKGWFLKKVYYQTGVASGAGLKEGDPVKLMGFDVGEITRITPNDPYDWYNITVEFWIKAPNFGYIWTDSKVRVAAGDLLGHRYLEVVKGRNGLPTVHEGTNRVPDGLLALKKFQERYKELGKTHTNEVEILDLIKAEAAKDKSLYYATLAKFPCWIEPEESPAVTERLEKLVGQIEVALPNFLALTNQINAVLGNTANLTSNLNVVAAGAAPAVTNIAAIVGQLNQPGALGEWLLPTNIHTRLESVMGGADVLLGTANTNLVNLNLAILNLADITSNLNAQVQANSNILSGISVAVKDADTFVQGLKKHWLLRSAFKKENEKEAEKKRR